MKRNDWQEITVADNVRVMVVDDHELFLEALVGLLDQEPDLEVVGTARTIEYALRLAQRHEPDVVLMDHLLPDGEGTDAAARIVAMLPATKVVMVTQFADDNVFMAALDAGCAGYVTKDKSAKELLEAIRAVAEGEAAIPPGMLGRVLSRLRSVRQGPNVDLTPREREILRLMALGLQTGEIAVRLGLSLSTVRNHIQNVLVKLGAHSKLEAVATAVRSGIVRIA
jgi:DNA-binding NarL/FixJ family response regulator